MLKKHKSQIFRSVKNIFKEKKSKKNKINYKSLSLSAPIFDHKEINNLIDSLLSGWISLGPKVKLFEKKFASKIGCKYGIATNSGSSANLIVLEALKKKYKLKKGDEVILPASTFATVVTPIIQVGLKPVFVDVDLNTMNISPNEIKKAITKKTKIILVVHTLGLSADMPSIIKIAKQKKILIFEDCCEAHGSKLKNKFTGSWGLISAFSFFVAHNMTTGEGGIICTNDKELKDLCCSFREFGRIKQNNLVSNRYFSSRNLKDYDKRYVFENIGYNMRMNDLSASLGIEQLKKLEKFNRIRIKNAKYLYSKLQLNFDDYFEFPSMIFNKSNTFYTFPILLKENIEFSRKDLCLFLETYKIETRPMMAGCLPDQPALKKIKYKIIGNLRNSKIIRDRVFFIGIHPLLDNKNFDYFIDVLKKFFKK